MCFAKLAGKASPCGFLKLLSFIRIIFKLVLLVHFFADNRNRLFRAMRKATVAHRAFASIHYFVFYGDVRHRAERNAQAAFYTLVVIRFDSCIITLRFSAEIQPLSEQPRNATKEMKPFFRICAALDFLYSRVHFALGFCYRPAVFLKRLFQQFDVAYAIGHFQVQAARNFSPAFFEQTLAKYLRSALWRTADIRL